MWYLWLIGFLAYMGVTWYSLQQSASPVVNCSSDPSSSTGCFHPLLSPGEPLTMQLFLYQQSNQSNRYQWIPVPTCHFNITVPSSGLLPVDIASGGNTSNCSVPLPDAARRRSSNAGAAQRPLQAKFRFLRRLDNSIVLDVPFEMTRIVRRSRSSMLWGNSDATAAARRNLLEEPLRGETTTKKQEAHVTEWVPFLKYGHAAIRIRFVAEYRPFGSLLRQDGIRLQPFNNAKYRPMIYVDDNSLQHMSQIELALPKADKPPIILRIKISALSPIMDVLNQQVGEILKLAESVLGSSEIDELRYFLQDEKLYRFLCTQIISFVHIWLDYLAFRDEVRFYRGRQNLKGVSVSSVMSRFVCSFIILLYLFDGGNTSWIVLVSMASSCAVEAWKVGKLLQPRFIFQWPFVAIRDLATSAEKDMAEYDRYAATKLAMILYPIVALWSIYALSQYTYASWWSWFISNLANAVYTFGFISLCPQLYVNYRLKSVAHLPWKVFMYKIFNTFVDDAFAWLLAMPLKHRLMALRDDVVFLVLLYQAYIYRVDKTRTNEFGYAYEEKSNTELKQELLKDEQLDLKEKVE